MKLVAIILAVAAPAGLALWLIRRRHRPQPTVKRPWKAPTSAGRMHAETPPRAGAIQTAPAESLAYGNPRPDAAPPPSDVQDPGPEAALAEVVPPGPADPVLEDESAGLVPSNPRIGFCPGEVNDVQPVVAPQAALPDAEILLGPRAKDVGSISPGPFEAGAVLESEAAENARAEYNPPMIADLQVVPSGELLLPAGPADAIDRAELPGTQGLMAPAAEIGEPPNENQNGSGLVTNAAPPADAPEEISEPADVEIPGISLTVELPFSTDDAPGQAEEASNARTGSDLEESEEGGEAGNGEAEPAAPLYRPVAPRRPRRVGPARPARENRASPSEVSLDVRVRLLLSRFGLRDIAFLPVRSSGVDDNEVLVKTEGTHLRLIAQEDWYQDLQFEDMGKYLRRGIELRGSLGDGRRVRWLLSGRELYVLATHPHASGFVSTNRLMTGRPHVVLCTPEMFERVEELLRVAGCKGYTRLDEDAGVPQGWIALRGVKPTRAVLADLGNDLLNAVKPAPDVEISLEGGIRLRNQDWLAGYPPEIKLFGNPEDALKIFIDGKEAERRSDAFIADGYGQPGPHAVQLEGLPNSRTYSIVEPAEYWTEWPAYRFSHADICGPMVRMKGAVRPVTVPMTNTLLLGAEPGQVFRCSTRRAPVWKGYVPFEIVWALPAQAFTCNKKTTRIIQLGSVPVSAAGRRMAGALGWSNAILNAGRKGLRLESDSAEAQHLWAEYKKVARAIWRASR